MAINRGSLATPEPSLRHAQNVSNMFYTAIEHDDITQVKILLKYEHVPLEKCNLLGQTPLHRCCHNGYLDLVRLLLEHGAKLETKDPRGWTAMHYAASSDHYDVVRFLLAHCASIAAKTMDGRLPFDYATHHRVRQLLLPVQRDVSPDATRSSSSSGVCTDDDDDRGHHMSTTNTLPRSYVSRHSSASKIPRALLRHQRSQESTSKKDLTQSSTDLEGLNLTLRRRPKKCSADSSYGRYLTPADRRATVYEPHSPTSENGDSFRDSSPINGRSTPFNDTRPRSPVAGLKRSQSTKIPCSRDSDVKEQRTTAIANWMRNSFGKRNSSPRSPKKHSLPVTEKEREDQQHHDEGDKPLKNGKTSSLSLRKRLRLLSIRRTASDHNISAEDTFLSPKMRRTACKMSTTT